MNSEMPKQFLLLNDTPILIHTLSVFSNCGLNLELIVVLPHNQIAHWKHLCEKFKCKIKHTIIEGGNTRFQSVKNGLNLVKDKSIVAIHDAVRPLVSKEIILNVFSKARKMGNAVTAIPVKDSLRTVNKKFSKSVDRNKYFLIQTPQCFRSDIIIKAYQQVNRKDFTDDASVAEAMGEKIYLVKGDSKNIKITYPEDILVAEVMLGLVTK